MPAFLIAAVEGASRKPHATAVLYFCVYSDLKELKMCDQCETFLIF